MRWLIGIPALMFICAVGLLWFLSEVMRWGMLLAFIVVVNLLLISIALYARWFSRHY